MFSRDPSAKEALGAESQIAMDGEATLHDIVISLPLTCHLNGSHMSLSIYLSCIKECVAHISILTHQDKILILAECKATNVI